MRATIAIVIGLASVAQAADPAEKISKDLQRFLEQHVVLEGEALTLQAKLPELRRLADKLRRRVRKLESAALAGTTTLTLEEPELTVSVSWSVARSGDRADPFGQSAAAEGEGIVIAVGGHGEKSEAGGGAGGGASARGGRISIALGGDGAKGSGDGGLGGSGGDAEAQAVEGGLALALAGDGADGAHGGSQGGAGGRGGRARLEGFGQAWGGAGGDGGDVKGMGTGGVGGGGGTVTAAGGAGELHPGSGGDGGLSRLSVDPQELRRYQSAGGPAGEVQAEGEYQTFPAEAGKAGKTQRYSG